ncbi:MAG: hypothetical protein PCFJNLEI_02198 [Verrucomicrobiae bacterium]|nr:hypothetical protein [Verrucomicrobiae bacterium]
MKTRILKSQRSIALVLTLAVLAVLSLIVIGFLVSMRTEQSAARNAVHVTVARQMGQAAVDNAVYLMRANMPALGPSNSFVTMAGAAVAWPTAPPAGGQLFSVSSAGTIDLNADQVIVSASNSLYATAADRQIVANWVNVATNGTDGSGGHPLIGRFAFWVDDEAAKLNINVAKERFDALGNTTSNLDLTVLLNIASSRAAATHEYARTNGFFSPEQWQMAGSGGSAITYGFYQQHQFSITPFSTDAGQTPWGSQKFYLNTDFASFQAEIDGGATNTLAAPVLVNWFGQTFADKYGGNVNLVKQMLANMCDFRYSPSGPTNTCTGAQGGYLDANGIPLHYLGLKRYPHLNEIGVQATYFRPNANEIQCKLWFLVEVVNPYDQQWGIGGQIRLSMDKLTYRVSNALGGWNYTCGYDTGWAQNALCPNPANVPTYASAQEVTYDITANIPANSSAVYEIPVWVGNPEAGDTNTVIDRVFARVNRVRLLQTQNASTSIRDWADTKDFDTRNGGVANQDHFAFTNNIQAVGATGPFPGYNDNNTLGIAKNDPRVRRFANWAPPGDGTAKVQPWTPVGFDNAYPTTLPNASGAQNSVVDMAIGTGIANLPNDILPSGAGLPAGTNVLTSPSFYMKTSTNNLPYESVGELGYIHTGLQWRTIRLQPWPAPESTANYIPDWAVLDIFSVTNAPLSGRININGIVTNLASATTPLRLTPLQGLLTGINSGNGLGQATDQLRIASNIYNLVWADTGALSWAAKRSTGGRTFNPGVFNMIGELCEIDLISTNGNPSTIWTNDFVREGRIRTFANLVTTRSDTFTVWGIGQAIQDIIDPKGTVDAGDLITAEVKVQAVVQRYEENGQAKFRTLYFRYLTP